MRFSLILVKADADCVAASRECGTCTACCVLPRIAPDDGFPEGKPGYSPCEHLCDGAFRGCAQYDQRPELCRDFACLWRAGIVVGDERRRPDRLGLMLTVGGENAPGRATIDAWELWDGASRSPRGWGVLETLRADGYRVYVRPYGVPVSLRYDGGDTLALARQLTESSRSNPRLLAKWLRGHTEAGNLELPDESALDDLGSLERGEPVAAQFSPPKE